MSIKIAHLSDTQIRNFKRHWEYKKSYENLCASLAEKKPDVIVVVGDIAHTKTQISPEFVDICVDYFRNLSHIAPLIIIPGNHDGNLNNLTRLDALSPIVKALNNRRISYFKDSGIYPLPNAFNGNIVVFSCFDENWPTKEQIEKSINPINREVTIGLFHGMVQGAVLQNGQPVFDSPYQLKDFLGKVDYLLLGDIHKTQILDEDGRAAYCGSYPQQNYGESIDKGYLLWTIESKDKHSVEFIQLPNVCPFYTVNLEKDLSIPRGLNIQEKSRIRVFSRQLNVFEKKELIDEFNQKFDPYELVFLDDVNLHRQDIKLASLDGKVEDLTDDNVQEKLIQEFLKQDELPESSLRKIFDINKRYNTIARAEDEILRNVQYKLGKMSFNNTFSYGENNEFDFSKRKGIIGIFGKNAVGKSSLVVDVPLYTMFNKISKKGVVKNDLIINENQEYCSSKMEIMIGRDQYVVDRKTGTYMKAGKTQGETEVDFRVFREDGSEDDKNHETRQLTDENIRKIFGTAEDFMATSVAPQWHLLGLIDTGGTDRQKLIGRYFDIDIFEQKYKLAKKDFANIKGELKSYEGKDFDKNTSEAQSKLKLLNEATKTYEDQEIETSEEIKSLEEKLEKIKDVTVKFGDNLKNLEREFDRFYQESLGCQRKMKDLRTYKCISNPNCCFREELKKYEDRMKFLDVEIPKIKNEIDQEKVKIASRDKEKDTRISILNQKISYAKMGLHEIRDKQIVVARDIGFCEAQLKEIQSQRKRYVEIREEYDVYDHFLRSMSKDGISKSIISNNLEVINSEIRKILSQGVGFSIELESAEDGKAVEIYFKHEKCKKRRIELCSGMEKTVAAIAIRAALVNVTTLPRSNIFVLDEVFTALDPEYMDAISKILEYLKQLFDSVIIITHIDAFKDFVDHVVEIERDDEGYSRICE